MFFISVMLLDTWKKKQKKNKTGQTVIAISTIRTIPLHSEYKLEPPDTIGTHFAKDA